MTPEKELVTVDNSPEKVEFRQSILATQAGMQKLIDTGEIESVEEKCTLTHHFVPINEKYGCGTYGREIFLPKGALVVGKIHRHPHLNFILKGKVSVNTEYGKKYFQAPCTFVSEPGLKRAVYAEEDTIWVTVHQTEHIGEEHLDKIEDEVISPTYEEIGLIASTEELKRVEGKV